jgi:GNAT superfamily N-acetyltransferase
MGALILHKGAGSFGRAAPGSDSMVVLLRMRIRPGTPNERAAVESLQFRASTELPAYRDAILQHPDSIGLASELLTEGRVRVAETKDSLIGFSVLLAPIADTMELDGLFVDPSWWRRGVGTALMLDAFCVARAEEAARIEVTANILATGFYEKLGFSRLHETHTRFGPAQRMRYLIGNDTK